MLRPSWVLETVQTSVLLRMHLFWPAGIAPSGHGEDLYSVEAVGICLTRQEDDPGLAILHYEVRYDSAGQMNTTCQIISESRLWSGFIAQATEEPMWYTEAWGRQLQAAFSKASVVANNVKPIEEPKSLVAENLYRLLGAVGQLKHQEARPAVLQAMENRLLATTREYTRGIDTYYKLP